MRKISDVVEQHIRTNESVLESLRLGVLNLSAYAQSIQPIIERQCMKPVRTGTIVVALSRLQVKVALEPPLTPKVGIDDLSLKMPLCDISFDKTKEVVVACRSLVAQLSATSNDFFTLTEGVHEVTVICSQEKRDEVLRTVPLAPKKMYENLLGISVRFQEKYLDIPNTLYALLGRLALQQINVLEIVSTYTELTFVVDSRDSQRALDTLSALMKK